MAERGQQTNPLSEIALAMAMAFFSIMVLALISMGGIVAENANPQVLESARHTIVQSKTTNNGKQAKSTEKSAFLIFYNERFLNSSFEIVEPKSWIPDGEPVLALPPTATLGDTVAAKAALPFPNIIITTLDDRWLNRLKELKK